MVKRLLISTITFLMVVFAAPGYLKANTSPRTVTDLGEAGWRFQFGDAPEAVKAPGFDDSSWEQVSVPHTWNRIGEYSLTRSAATNNKQGNGWYRLTFNAPPSAKGRRQYLDFAAVAIIADVWVNGAHVGQHKGGYSRFRFDVTAAWKPGAANLIVVKADNSKPAPGSSTEHVMPLAGDFFQHGGIYRGVSLIEANDVGIDLLDFGGPGVYARTPVVEDAYSEAVMTIRLRNSSSKSRKLRVEGWIGSNETHAHVRSVSRVNLKPNSVDQIELYPLNAGDCPRWDGSANPFLCEVTIEITEGRRVVDNFTQSFGIRTFKFDPNTGFTLNGKPLKLKGVSRHQDRLGKGYALSREDHAEDMRIIKEMGANSVRHAHYQHADEWSDEADKAGMLVWAEVPFVTTPSFTGGEGSPELFANAEQQTRELIRQNYNHPSIVMWSVGNEVDASALFGVSKEPVKPLKLLRHIARIAKEEDPSRPTVFADCCEDVRVSSMAGTTQVDSNTDKLAGATDLIGYNRYYGWYYPQPLKAAEQLATQMDKFHAKHPSLPISISEYGAGGATTQHSDNVLTGFINAVGRPQPEEYESWVHEQSWPVIRDRNYIWGSYVWNMFDFASDLRNEGDAVDINTKGLVTMDRMTKKDAFYFYKASWSEKEYFVHITGTRYADRAYPVMDVKAYTTEKRAQLRVGAKDYPEIDCPNHVCVWPNVALAPGPNRMTVSYGELGDSATFNGPDPFKDGIRIDAGDIAGRALDRHCERSGPKATEGQPTQSHTPNSLDCRPRIRSGGTMTGGGVRRFGSDTFVTGGTPQVLNQGGFGGRGAPKRIVAAANPELYDHWREGDAFSYAIPIPNGTWTVTIHSFDPGKTEAGSATMSVAANGKEAIPPLNVSKASGGPLSGIAGSFPVTVKNGILKLDFAGQGGKAVVAAIEIMPSARDRK